MQSQELSNKEKVQSSFELISWRTRYFSKNQNAFGHHHSENEDISLSNQKENQELLNTSSPSTNFTSVNPVEIRINANDKPEKIDSTLSEKSVTITRRSSKPSRHECVQIATSQTRQHQRDRYINYRNRLEENQLYSLVISSDGIKCYGLYCQPSVFHASHQCRTTSSEKDIDAFKKSPLMNDQNIKQNISYISLTNLSNIIDHEPNVSRKDSYSRSTSNILMHKPSSFIAAIFNKMTHEQRAKSISQLVKLHENLTKSNTTVDKPQRTTSLPNFNNKSTKLHSVTSLLSEKTTTNIAQMENKTVSTSPTAQNPTDIDMNSQQIKLETSNDKRTTDLNTELTSAFIDQKVDTPVQISKLPDNQTISSPVKLVSLSKLDPFPEHKLSEENKSTIHTNDPSATTSEVSSLIVHLPMIKPSPLPIKSNHTVTSIGKKKINRSNHSLDADLNEQISTSKLKSIKTSKTELSKTHSSNLSNPTEFKTIISSSNSVINSTPVKKQQSDHKIKSETNLENNNNLFLKSSGKHYSKNDINQTLKASSSSNKAIDHISHSNLSSTSITTKEKQIPSSSPHFQSSNDEIEIANSLNDVTDHLSQQDIIISNTNLDKSFDISIKESNQIKNTSPAIPTSKKILSKTPTKPELTSLLPIDNGDISMINRTTTASTNLTITTDDDDEQSKLINEQLKRSSLGLARDSLELLRNVTSHHDSNEEQLTPHTNIDSTPHIRKSVLKPRIDSSDNLQTPELISYIAIDEVEGDERLMEKQMRRRSLTVGGGTIISCTSPKPKRDSLMLLQERYSGFTTPHSGYYHLSSPDSRHVEFIREPGDTITPVLHIGRGTKSKQTSIKPMSSSSSNDHCQHTCDTSERSKSEISVKDSQQRSALDSASRHRTPQTQLSSTTTSFINTDDIEEEKVCFNKSDYDEIVRLIMTPLSKKKRKYPIKSILESNIESCSNNRLTTFQNLILLILLILLIFFYIFIFIKSQYWQEQNQK